MKTFTKQLLTITMILGLIAGVTTLQAQTGEIAAVAVGPASVVLQTDTADATGFRVEFKTGLDAFVEITSFDDTVIRADGKVYLLHTGLDKTTEYVYQLTPFDGVGDGTAVRDTITTADSVLLSHSKFESETDGWVAEEISGRTDTLINAGIVPSGLDSLGNAVKFESFELIPGSGIYENSILFLDSAFYNFTTTILNEGQNWRAYDFTELSYSFWFKNQDPAAATYGSVLTAFGDNVGNAVVLYNDSIWVGNGMKIAGDKIHTNNGVPFADTNWNHAVYVYKQGMLKLYLNGVEVINLDESDLVFWNGIRSRLADHWSSSSLGCGYWWGRAANDILPENFGDKEYHHQFNGMMDELKVFSYALSEDEIAGLMKEVVVIDTASFSVVAKGPNSLALEVIDLEDMVDVQIDVDVVGAGSFAEANQVQKAFVNGKWNIVIDGLTEDTDYAVKVTPDYGFELGTPAFDTAMTTTKELVVHVSFDTVGVGWVHDDLSDKRDTLINVEVVASGKDTLGNAAKFGKVELIPGSGIYDYSILFLDTIIDHLTTTVINAGNGHKGWRFTEGSYSFWFKVEDQDAANYGAVLTAFGDNPSNAVVLYNDSLWVSTGNKFGPEKVHYAGGVPLTSMDWNNATVVFKDGMVDLYLNGEVVVSLDQTDSHGWTQISTRNDHWSSSSLGAGYWWGRAANFVLPENFGDKMFHHQFEGMMDDLKMWNYALTSAEVEEIVGMLPVGDASTTIVGVGPESVALAAASENATSFMFEAKTGAEDFAEVVPAVSSNLNNKNYFLLDGMTEASEYIIRTTPVFGVSTGAVAMDTIMTRAKVHMTELSFSKDTARGAICEITGDIDSLENVVIADSAAVFKSVEAVPGSGIYMHPVVYLDRSFDDYWTFDDNWRKFDYTEASYAFWFKVNDPDDMMANGGILAAMGDNLASCIAIYNDSLWVGTGIKDGPAKIQHKAGMPFISNDWTHVAFVYKNGMVELWVNGEVALTLDDTEEFFWNRISLRANDYWSKSNLGGVYQWNRAAKGIIDAMTGDPRIQFPFQGIMDEFNSYSYAIDSATVAGLIEAGHNGPTGPEPAVVEIYGQGPNSIAIGNKSAADSYVFEIKEGTGDFAEATPTLSSSLRYDYFLFDGLTEAADYIIKTTPIDEFGLLGTPDLDTTYTVAKELLVEHPFDALVDDYYVEDVISGELDSVENAIVADGAILFQSVEAVPGSGIYTNAALYLNNSIPWLYDNDNNDNWYRYDYTEATYGFWFKVEDPDDMMANGGILAAFGDNLSSTILLYNDSLWVGTGIKDGPNKIQLNAGMPFTSTDWTHVAFVYKDGIADLYVDGTKELTIDQTDQFFFNRLSLRANDYWSNSTLGCTYNWNRAAKGIIDAMTGDPRIQFPFQGYIDEFLLFSYAIDETELGEIIDYGIQNPVSIDKVTDAGHHYVYPNPAVDRVLLSQETVGQVDIYDMTGKLVMSKELYGETELNVSSLNSGLFIFKITTAEETIVQQIMIK